jgi:hypothetical protein
MSKKAVVGAMLLGLSVFVLLGAYGLGEDSAADLFVWMGVDPAFADNASRMLGGLSAGLAAFLITWGWLDDKDGRMVSHEEFVAVKAAIYRHDLQSAEKRS